MASVNKVILLGNLGSDPDVDTLKTGTKIAKFSLATTHVRKNDRNERVESTEWHRVTFFGRLAEIAEQYLMKGSSCHVEGRLKTDRWEDSNGQTHYSTQIIGETLQLLGSNMRR